MSVYSTRWISTLVALFAFRLAFGLSSEFFFEDETQIYLLGLRYHATGRWPFFGPDVVWTKSEIPGALQALLVGVPLNVAPIPESPLVLLNVLSMGALAALAWYLSRRLPSVPRWLLWGWLFTLPWTLQFSTHVINPSYVLPAAIVFFLGFFEAVPVFRLGAIAPPLAYFMMGAAVAWIMQIHLSWPLLLPYAATAWIGERRHGLRVLVARAFAFAMGALVPGALLLPTLLTYGASAGSGGTLRNIDVHWVSPWVLVTTLARLFSFASLEINRFVATDDAKRLAFFAHDPWLVPLAAIVWLTGILQPIGMLVACGRRWTAWPEWPALKRLVAASVVLVYVSYWFVLEPPQAHAFYLLAPIAFVFAAYCWTFVDSRRARAVAGVVLAVNVAFHAGLAWVYAREKSLYRHRAVVAAAIRFKQPEMLAHRRPFAVDGGPSGLEVPSRPFDALRDVTLADATYRVGLGGFVTWTGTIRNANERVTFRDVLCVVTYRDEAGRIVEERPEFIRDIFEPGDQRRVEINDGIVRAGFASATIRVAAAEALLPSAPDPDRQ